MADGFGHQAADGVVVLIGEGGTEALVEIADRRERIHHVLAIGLDGDLRREILGLVVFVVDVADDLLQHVFDGDQAGDTAVLVHHDRHVVARQAELLQQHVELLRFRNQHRRAQQFTYVARTIVGNHAAQQVLGQQHAEDVVLVLAMHREARMAGLDHLLHQLQEGRLHRQRDHLRTRDHHVAHGQLGYRNGTFHHLQGIGGDQPFFLRGVQDSDQLVAGVGFAGKSGRQAFKPAALLFTVLHGGATTVVF
ncbi:hypothetical protein D3C73_964790 [compost metagenome]